MSYKAKAVRNDSNLFGGSLKCEISPKFSSLKNWHKTSKTAEKTIFINTLTIQSKQSDKKYQKGFTSLVRPTLNFRGNLDFHNFSPIKFYNIGHIYKKLLVCFVGLPIL